MRTSDFDFEFPASQIALHPLPRGEARLMVVPRNGALPADFPLPVEPEGWAFGHAADVVLALREGDALALNDTKVLRARLRGRLENGSECEVLLLRPRPSDSADSGGTLWECLARPGRKLKPGTGVEFPAGLSAQTVSVEPGGERVLRFHPGGADFFRALDLAGEIPLPPYIRRPAETADMEAYQSVFAANPGSVAAPTASLHWSQAMLEAARRRGVRSAPLTLHVGAGTFRPVQTEAVDDHPMHAESFALAPESADILNAARREGGRVVSVGTTSARVLEDCCDPDGIFRPRAGETCIFIRPGHRWKGADVLLTNFHWPRSTLFMLVCSLLGTERAKAAYAEAIRRGFRLFSYGDAMLIV